MKKTALIAAAIAITTAPSAAADGYLGAQYATGESDTVLFGAYDSEGWRGEGAFGFGGAGWGGQVDGQFGNNDLDGFFDFDTWDQAAHLWWNGGSWRLGGVIAHSDADAGVGALEVDETVYGLEGTWDVGASAVLIGSLTFGDGNVFGLDYDTSNLDVGANFYFSPNIRIGGRLGVGEVDFNIIGDVDSLSFGLSGEFQPWSAPVSITAGWDMYQIDDFSVDTNMFRVGARWNFGGGTLRDRDNSVPFETRTGVVPRTIGAW